MGDTSGMTTTAAVGIDRIGPAIRLALAEHAPEATESFEAELRAALTAAAEDLDLARVASVLDRWHAPAMMAANPLAPGELTQLARARSGDFSGLRHRGADDAWSTV